MTDDRRRIDRVPDDVDISDVEARYPEEEGEAVEVGEDFLDGMCDLDFEMAPRTDDSEIAALALFASTDFTDPEAVAARRAEWASLFPPIEGA